MLNLEQIEQYYPENLRAFKKNILREYLQYKILEIIFNSKFSDNLSFLGGTALRIVYNNSRFSEDLDFDNFGIKANDFKDFAAEIKRGLEYLGYEAEIKNVLKGAYRCYIRIPKILFDNKIAATQEEKILIQIDTAPHNFSYRPEKTIINKFDVFTQIAVTPLDILLSQKIYAIFNRKRFKGRDFFDVIFLFQKSKPNYLYLEKKLKIKNADDLKKKLLRRVANTDFVKIIKDVEPFLFNPHDSQKINLFKQYIKDIKL